MAIALIVTILASFYAVSILNRERPVEAGEVIKMLGACIVFLVVAVVVLAVLMIGSAETDWAVILPIAAASIVGVIIGAGLGGIALRTMGGDNRRSAG